MKMVTFNIVFIRIRLEYFIVAFFLVAIPEILIVTVAKQIRRHPVVK